MIVTLNEVQRACQKALFGAGVPAGLDDDAANATVWLEARGLSALAAFAGALESCAQDPSGCTVTETAPGVVDASGCSATLAGSLVIDLAVARANAKGTATLKVTRLKDPQFLVPWAAEYFEDDWGFSLTWNGRAASVHSAGGVMLLGDWASPDEGPCDVTVACRYSEPGGSNEPLPVAYRGADLESRAKLTLSTGLEVDDAVWQMISRHAQRALVPATEESRARGAGSTASDNE